MQVPTYLCADRTQRDLVLDRLGELVVKPIDGYGGLGITIGPECSEAELAARREDLLTRVAPAGSMIVNSSRGGGKDTWIMR